MMIVAAQLGKVTGAAARKCWRGGDHVCFAHSGRQHFLAGVRGWADGNARVCSLVRWPLRRNAFVFGTYAGAGPNVRAITRPWFLHA